MFLVSFEGGLAATVREKILQLYGHSITWPEKGNFTDPQQEIVRRSEMIENLSRSEGEAEVGIIYACNYVTDLVLKVAKDLGDLKELVDMVELDHIWWPDLVCLHPQDTVYGLVISAMFPGCEILFTEDLLELDKYPFSKKQKEAV